MRPQKRWRRLRGKYSAPRGFCAFCQGRILQGRKDRRWHDGRAGEPRCSQEFSHKWRWWNSTSYVRAMVFRRDGGRCVDCGKVCSAPEWQADHERPLRDGGRHTMANLRTRCLRCHRAKTSREAKARALRRRRIPIR